ncbi:MAG TPA: hypothetical protein VIQ00_05180 [Chitinophagaceae bacterium]
MKQLILFSMIFFLGSCANKEFLHHELKVEKLEGDCATMDPGFKMNSNLNGERYEFERCLPVDFTDEQLKVERRGDSVVLNFPKAVAGNQLKYKIIIDIDTWPRYNFLTIDDNTFQIKPAEIK